MLLRRVVTLLLCGVCAIGAQAQPWDAGGGADTSWFNPLNWNPNVIPVQGASTIDTQQAANCPSSCVRIS